MNSNAIARKTFEKKSFGYKTDDVSSYLKEVAEYCAALEENIQVVNEKLSDSETKIEVLADKIRDYRDQEESLKDAIMSAHKIGSEISANAKAKALQITDEAKTTSEKLVSDAKAEAAEITKEASEKAEDMLGQRAEQAASEQRRLDALKKEVADFKASLYSLYKRHLKLIDRLPDAEKTEQEEPPVPEIPDITSSDISSSSEPSPESEETPAEAPEETTNVDDLVEDVPPELEEAAPEEEEQPDNLDITSGTPAEETEQSEEPPVFVNPSEYEELPSFLKNVYEQPQEDEINTEDISDLYHKHEAEKTRLASNDKLNMKITVKAKSDIKSFDDNDFISKSSDL